MHPNTFRRKIPAVSHVVVLGAGASRAAFPDGDHTGEPLPVMADLVELLDLGPLLTQHGIELTPSINFEDVFTSLYESGRSTAVVRELENRIRAYFATLQLPPRATLYDRLVLALQPHDVIATFNWDPLLYQAYHRNLKIARLPQIVALHGSVALGACAKHGAYGFGWNTCSTCDAPFAPVRLLYPVRQKRYYADGFIAHQWETLRRYMRHAVCLTIFGYSAPATDVEAVRLLTEMAAKNSAGDWAHLEIIDIKSESELRAKWLRFFHEDHYSISGRFSDSILAQYPRRSREMVFRRFVTKLHQKGRLPSRGTFVLRLQQPQPMPETDDLSVLQNFVLEMTKKEPSRGKRAG